MPATETHTEAILEHLVRHALEVMCFAEAQRLPSLPLMVHPVEARSGYLQIEIDSAAARALTAAFLGVEHWHPSVELHTHDAMQELARVLSGRLVSSLDPAARFETETIRQAFRLSAGTLCVTLQLS
jgi:3-deoxy-D-arabino-heptulosonate 7-phosphate (DAHP) synthase